MIALFAFQVRSPAAVPPSETPVMKLDIWEVNTGKGWFTSGPVPWETPVEKGGIGDTGYDGFGEYRTEIVIPESWKGFQLAFYAKCIDDADLTFFNNRMIGATGIFPQPDDPSKKGFRSGVWQSRLYPIPTDAVVYGQKNTLRISVYDFSGNGGIESYSVPMIGAYTLLAINAENDRSAKIIPRAGLIAVILIMMMFLVLSSLKHITIQSLKYSFKKIRDRLNIFRFYRSGEKDSARDAAGEILFRYFVFMLILAAFIVFILAEIPFKYNLISSERFWFKAPVIALYIDFIAIMILLHLESFGDIFVRSRKKVFIIPKIFFSGITHPFFLSAFIIYPAITPAELSFSGFIYSGIIIIASVLSVLFLYNSLTIFRMGLFFKGGLRLIFWKEVFARSILVLSLIIVAMLFKFNPQILQMQSAPLIAVVLIFYSLFSVHFYARYQFAPPFIPADKSPRMIGDITMKKIDLAVSYIRNNLSNELSRESVAESVGIHPDSLSRIFKKVKGKRIDLFINDLRIDEAKKFLAETDRTIIQIAFDTGFDSVRTFNRVFYEKTGLTPTDFRRGKNLKEYA